LNTAQDQWQHRVLRCFCALRRLPTVLDLGASFSISGHLFRSRGISADRRL
jgi:hypothetical protein